MKILFSLLLCLSFAVCNAQNILKPGFNSKEYLELLSLAFYSSGIPDSTERSKKTDAYKMEFRSPEVGLLNRWTLYLRNDNTAVIDVRGTVNQAPSWVANFYAAMIPATGTLQINDSIIFEYQLASDSKAMVHAGWTVALAHLGPDIVQKINTYYKEKGIKEYYVFGHSQGGAIAFLLRSYLHYEMEKGHLPKDLVIKTYCSAAPKPGNMYYAYDFDFITRNNWAFTIVNAYDWVPESPFTVQTLHDFNPGNPLINAKAALKNQKMLVRWAGNMVYNKLDRATRKSQRRFEKYLGRKIFKIGVKKTLPALKEPSYANGNNFMRAGIPIVLMPDEEYRNKFPVDPQKPFGHHLFASYASLVMKYYPQEK
jgi:pimeloyl-ACP methyl ester carboxylesterase